jgi:predicted ATPase
VVAFWVGNFVESRGHLQQALGRYAVEHHALHTALYIQDTGVVCLIRLAFTLWYLGYSEQAQQHCAEAIDLARRLGHPFSLAYALSFAAWVYNDCRNIVATNALITELLNHCEKHGIQYWLPLGYVLQGHLLAKQGEVDRGIAQIRAGMLAYQSSGHYIFRPYALAMIAQAYAQASALDQGLAALDEALVSVEQHGDYWYAAELHRLKGELLAQLGATATAVESCYQQALTIARQQQARSLEMRAATSLARLWQQTGRAVRARRLLSQVYDWFSEGLQTPDLQAAAALLQELS